MRADLINMIKKNEIICEKRHPRLIPNPADAQKRKTKNEWYEQLSLLFMI